MGSGGPASPFRHSRPAAGRRQHRKSLAGRRRYAGWRLRKKFMAKRTQEIDQADLQQKAEEGRAAAKTAEKCRDRTSRPKRPAPRKPPSKPPKRPWPKPPPKRPGERIPFPGRKMPGLGVVERWIGAALGTGSAARCRCASRGCPWKSRRRRAQRRRPPCRGSAERRASE